MKFIYALLISIIITSGLIYLAVTINPMAWDQKYGNTYGLIYLSLLSVFFIYGILRGGMLSALKKLSQFGVWIALIFILVGFYGFRMQIQNFFNIALLNLIPSKVSISQDGSVQIAKSSNGHFMVTANVNNSPVYFLIDTGATEVSLTLSDARRAGIDISALEFNQATSTANGTNYAASIIISTIKIGNIELNNIKGNVIKEGLDTSLLGMSFLNQLTSYSFQNDIFLMEKK